MLMNIIRAIIPLFDIHQSHMLYFFTTDVFIHRECASNWPHFIEARKMRVVNFCLFSTRFHFLVLSPLIIELLLLITNLIINSFCMSRPVIRHLNLISLLILWFLSRYLHTAAIEFIYYFFWDLTLFNSDHDNEMFDKTLDK